MLHILLMLMLLLVGCQESDNDADLTPSTPTTPILGRYAINQGAIPQTSAPMNVVVHELDDNLKKIGRAYSVQTDSHSQFSLKSIRSRFVEVSVSSNFYNALFQGSPQALTLSAIVDLEHDLSPNINLFTTLQSQRLQQLYLTSRSYQQAELQSRQELLTLFASTHGEADAFLHINLLSSTPYADQLLKSTAAFLRISQLDTISGASVPIDVFISKLQQQLADDGKVDNQANISNQLIEQEKSLDIKQLKRDTVYSLITQIANNVAFWDFSEPENQARIDKKQQFALQEVGVGGSIKRVESPFLSGYAAEFNGKGKSVLKVPRALLGDLDINGRTAQFTIFSLIKIADFKKTFFIAGIWDEGNGPHDDSGTRQYGLFLNMAGTPAVKRVAAHVSSEGGVTRRADGSGFPWCLDYAVNQHELAQNEWLSVTFSYDSDYVRVYINGQLDSRAGETNRDNYFLYGGPNNTNRGMNPYYHGRGIFKYDPVLHALTKPRGGSDFTVGGNYALSHPIHHAFTGAMAGLLVFNRALSADEIANLHHLTQIK